LKDFRSMFKGTAGACTMAASGPRCAADDQ